MSPDRSRMTGRRPGRCCRRVPRRASVGASVRVELAAEEEPSMRCSWYGRSTSRSSLLPPSWVPVPYGSTRTLFRRPRPRLDFLASLGHRTGAAGRTGPASRWWRRPDHQHPVGPAVRGAERCEGEHEASMLPCFNVENHTLTDGDSCMTPVRLPVRDACEAKCSGSSLRWSGPVRTSRRSPMVIFLLLVMTRGCREFVPRIAEGLLLRHFQVVIDHHRRQLFHGRVGSQPGVPWPSCSRRATAPPPPVGYLGSISM